jgi:Arm DNA-binding domain
MTKAPTQTPAATPSLTAKAVEALLPKDKRYEVRDGAEAGLRVAVSPSGAKTFIWRYSFKDRDYKLTIGSVSLAEARKRVREARVMRDEGINPAVAKAVAKAEKVEEARQIEQDLRAAAGDLVEDVAAKFVEKHHKPTNRSWQEAERLINKEIVTPWRGRRLSQITKADIHDLLDDIIERPAPVVANRIFAHLRAMCRWAQGRGIIDRSPCEGITKPTPEKSRERVLNDKELSLVWRASESMGFPFGQKKTAAEYRLTHLHCDATSTLPSKKFMRLDPVKEAAE